MAPSISRAHLRLVCGTPVGASPPPDPTSVTVGREPAPSATSLVLDDARMSRQHARVERSTIGWRLRDLGSRNGGFVDGAAFEPDAVVPLEDGALVRLGDSMFVFRSATIDDSDADDPAFPGVSPVAAAVRLRLRALAAAAGHALVLGETGTGKERAARSIGAAAPSRAFVAVNCAELSPELARSELFGHARGAFSSAVTASDGLVDAANDGVLFLDEVGELALEVQGDLLRFLEDGSYRRVGSTEVRTSRARVVAATNVPIEEAVRTGRFRRDLLARLRATNPPLELPPLRERREDILGWARMFLEEALPGPAPESPWSAGVVECLLLYPWPENLRELRGVVRALASPGRWPVPSSALPARLRMHRRGLRAEPDAPGDGPAAHRSEDPPRDEIERALLSTQGRMRRASEVLGVERRKLYRLCEKLGIDVESFRTGGG